MMRRVSGRYKGFRCAQRRAGVKGCVRDARGADGFADLPQPEGNGASARGAAVKPSLAPVRNEMLNASGSRRIIMGNLVKATARGRRWYATTVKNVLDRAVVDGVKDAA